MVLIKMTADPIRGYTKGSEQATMTPKFHVMTKSRWQLCKYKAGLARVEQGRPQGRNTLRSFALNSALSKNSSPSQGI